MLNREQRKVLTVGTSRARDGGQATTIAPIPSITLTKLAEAGSQGIEAQASEALWWDFFQ